MPTKTPIKETAATTPPINIKATPTNPSKDQPVKDKKPAEKPKEELHLGEVILVIITLIAGGIFIGGWIAFVFYALALLCLIILPSSKKKLGNAFIALLIGAIVVGAGWLIQLGINALIPAIGNIFTSAETKCQNESKIWFENQCITEAEKAQIEADRQSQAEQEQQQAEQQAEQQAKNDCTTKGFNWNETENRCNTETEEKETCTAKGYHWNYTAWRCNSEEEEVISDKTEAETAEDQKLEAECKAKGSNWHYTPSTNNCYYEAPQPSAAQKEAIILTACVQEYTSTLGSSAASSECVDEFDYLASAEIDKVFNAILSGASYSSALSQL